MIVVFDFDKTLTYKDTLWGFYKFYVGKSLWGRIKMGIMFLFMILHRLNMISNMSLKRAGVYLFLKGELYEEYNEKARAYSRMINLNRVFYQDYHVYPEKYVLSASFVEYLKPLFPNAKVIASEVSLSDNRIVGVKQNCYGFEKKRILSERGINGIDYLYTDSISDLPLAEISNDIFLVKGNDVIFCSNIKEFKESL